MNKARILELADHLEDENVRFNMGDYFFDCDADNICQSPACIAGHAVVLFGNVQDLKYEAREKTGHLSFINWVHGYAANLLNLEDVQADFLFLPNEDNIDYDCVARDEAVKVLRHLAETGRVEWETFYGGPCPGEL